MTVPNGMPTEIDLPDISKDNVTLYFSVDHQIDDWNRVSPTSPYYKEQTERFGTLILVDNTTGSSIVLGDAEEMHVYKLPDGSGSEGDSLDTSGGALGTLVFKDGTITAPLGVDLLNKSNNTDPNAQWIAAHLKVGTPADAFGAETAWQVTLHSSDPFTEVNYDLSTGSPLQGPPAAPSGTPAHGAPNGSTRTVEADGSTLLARYDASGALASARVAEPGGSVSDYTYTAGALSREVLASADGSRTVFTLGVTGQSYATDERVYDSSSVLTQDLRTHTDGTPDYTLTRGAEGGQTAIQYDATGQLIVTRNITNADGSRDDFAYTAGVLTRETQIHADGTKDIVLSNVTGQSYVTDHRTYDAGGTLTADLRTHADGSTDYSFTLDSSGVATRIQYDSTGEALQSENVLNPDGSSDDFIYTGGVLAREDPCGRSQGRLPVQRLWPGLHRRAHRL